MIDAIQKLYDAIIGFFNGFWNFLSETIFDVATWAFAQFVEYLTLGAISFQLWALDFAWGVAKQILVDLDFTNKVTMALGLLPESSLSIVNALGVTQCLSLIFTALITKYVLRFIPGA